jgi:hypothetical protein
MAISPDVLEKLRQETEYPALDLRWMEAGTEWGVRAKAGRNGLTLEDINVGSYGEIPELATTRTLRPRGAAAREDALAIKLPAAKAETWADACAMLYEEANQRQWSSATDIPWETIEPLPDDLELAMCQLCTFLTEVEFIAGDLPGKWMPYIATDHYEAALFLGTQIMDEARHLDVFRKRALANGCGLLQGFGGSLSALFGTMNFTEMSVFLHIVGEGFVQSMFRMGEYIAQNEAEKRIFRLSAQDESRHVGFGVMHLKYVMQREPERREEIHQYLDNFESLLGGDGGGVGGGQAAIAFNPATTEALVIVLGGGKKNVDEGMKKLMAVRRKMINEYMHRLEVAGLPERRQRCKPAIIPFLDPPKN